MKPLSLNAPHLIVMVGIPGSGKTFFADKFAATFNAPIVSFEKIAQEIYGSYNLTSDEQAVVVRVSHSLLAQLLKTGQTVVYEGITDTRTTRQALAKIAQDNNYEPLMVWVQTESVAAKTRATKSIRGVPAMTVDQFDTVLRRFTVPNAGERAVVISGKHTYASQLRIVLKRLADVRAIKADASAQHRIIESRQIIVR
jgi:predicted kinase